MAELWAIPDVISLPVPKKYLGDKDTTFWVSLYPGDSGNIYLSKNGVPVQWQQKTVRDTLTTEKVCQLYIAEEQGQQQLKIRNLTSQALGAYISDALAKAYTLDFLCAGNFVTPYEVVAGAMTASNRFKALQISVAAMLAQGIDREMIIYTLRLDVESPEMKWIFPEGLEAKPLPTRVTEVTLPELPQEQTSTSVVDALGYDPKEID